MFLWATIMEVEGLCTEYKPGLSDQPCGMDSFINYVEIGIGAVDSTGHCCTLQGAAAGQLVTDNCYQNIVVCDQAYYVPRETKYNDTDHSYLSQLDAVRLHIDPTLAGTIGGTVCYYRIGAIEDGCDCLCAILLQFGLSTNPELTNCSCVRLP